MKLSHHEQQNRYDCETYLLTVKVYCPNLNLILLMSKYNLSGVKRMLKLQKMCLLPWLYSGFNIYSSELKMR